MSAQLEAHIRLLSALPVRTHLQQPVVLRVSRAKKNTARVRTLKQTSKLRSKVLELKKLGLTNPQIGRRMKISRQLAYYLLK